MRTRNFIVTALFAAILLGCFTNILAQGNLYTARGYWEESTKPNYLALKQRIQKGDSLSVNEKGYVKDYEVYLASYYDKMSEDEKNNYLRLKPAWDAELEKPKSTQRATPEDFELRTKDRLANGLYGLYYGLSAVGVFEVKDAAAAGIPLITSGLWMLGPAINAKKYKDVTRSTIRAGNTGRLLGIGYGIGLGLMVSNEQENNAKWVLGMSTVGSIVLGELAFQREKFKNYSPGHVEMVRHYGFIGPWVAIGSAVGAGSKSTNINGGAIFVGGVAGLIIGNKVAAKYDYSRGDADVIGSLSLISTGIGLSIVADNWKSGSEANSLAFIPVGATIIGTIVGQKQVRGAYLTDQQGSTVNLASGGSALIAAGVLAIAKNENVAVWIGVPSAAALITHQIFFHKYKNANLAGRLKTGWNFNGKYNLSLKMTPENYIYNQSLPFKEFSPANYANLQNPIFKLTLKF